MRISDWSSDVCSSDLGLARTSSPADERLPTIHPPSCSIPGERHLPERQTFRTRTSGTSGFMCAPTAQREPHCAPREPHKDHPLHSNEKRPSRGVECPIIRIYCCAVQKETRRQRGEATPAPARQYFAAPGESC